jgi:lipopolysaccharide export system permease protein
MRRLDRYIFREIAVPAAIALAALTFVLFSHEMGRFLEIIVLQSAGLAEIWELAVAVLPNALTVTIPIAALIGILTGFGRMSSDSETVALRAVGVSMRRILVPVMALAVLAALAGLGLTVCAAWCTWSNTSATRKTAATAAESATHAIRRTPWPSSSARCAMTNERRWSEFWTGCAPRTERPPGGFTGNSSARR